MKRIILLAIFCSAYINLHAQDLEWVKFLRTRIGANSQSTVNDITTDNYGNVFVTGLFQVDSIDFDPGPDSFFVNPSNQKVSFILKLDVSGNFLWVKTFKLNYASMFVFSEMEIDKSDNIVLVGKYNGSIDVNPSTSLADTFFLSTVGTASNSFVLKLDNDGNFLWANQTIRNTLSHSEAIHLGISTNNDIVIAGAFKGTVNFNSAGVYNLNVASPTFNSFLWKLDANGNFVWAKALASSEDNQIEDIRIDKNNRIICCGTYLGTTDFDPSTSVNNLITSNSSGTAFLWKLSADANFIWVKEINSIGNVAVQNILVDVNNNYILNGGCEDSLDLDVGIGEYKVGPKNITSYINFIVKIDSNANFTWAKTWNSNHDTSYAFLWHIKIDNTNSIYADLSFEDSLDIDPSTNTNMMYGSVQAMYIKLDQNGNLVSYCKHNNSQNSSINNRLGISDLHVDSKRNIYTIGYYRDSAYFDCQGNNPYSFASNTGRLYVTKFSQWPLFNDELESNLDDGKPYPNPTTNEVNIKLEASLLSTINLYNVNGQKVKSVKSTNNSDFTLNLEQPGGIYFLEIINGKSTKRYKIIKN
jgi:hypothetical protein